MPTKVFIVSICFSIFGCGFQSMESERVASAPSVYNESPKSAYSSAQEVIDELGFSNTGADIIFPEGTHEIDCSNQQDGYCIVVSGANNITISGSGSGTTLILKDPSMAFAWIAKSSNVTVQNLTIDYKTLPFTQGKVNSIDKSKNTIEVSLDAGYPSLADPLFNQEELARTFGMSFNPKNKMLRGDSGNHYKLYSTTQITSNRYKIQLDKTENISVNDGFAIGHRGGKFIIFDGNNGITVKDLEVYSAPGLVTSWAYNEGRILIDGLRVLTRPGTSRFMSSSADAIHMYGNSAKVGIKNCYFQGLADDAINIRASGMNVAGVSGSIVWMDNLRGVKSGHQIQFVDSNTDRPKLVANITDVVTYSDNSGWVTLDQVPVGIKAGDYAFDPQLASPYATIRSNHFANFRGKLRIRSTGAIFTDNIFGDARNGEIFIAADIVDRWQEGPSLDGSLFSIYSYNNYVHLGQLSILGTNYLELGPPVNNSLNSLRLHPLVFNSKVYRDLNTDLSGMNDTQLSEHWLNHGIREGRRAQFGFSSVEYLWYYLDLYQSFGPAGFLSGLDHYLLHGAVLENRTGSVMNHALVFNVADYSGYNSDLATMSTHELNIHWLRHGIYEGRRASLEFWSQAYLLNNPDLREAYGADNYFQAIWHYVKYGHYEGRSGN